MDDYVSTPLIAALRHVYVLAEKSDSKSELAIVLSAVEKQILPIRLSVDKASLIKRALIRGKFPQ